MIFLENSSPEFENDIRALLMAFFTGEKISTSPCEWDKHLLIHLDGERIFARIEMIDGEKREKEIIASDGSRGIKDTLKTLAYELLSSL